MSERSNEQLYTCATKRCRIRRKRGKLTQRSDDRIALRNVKDTRHEGFVDVLSRRCGHPLNDTKSTTVATKAVSQVAADDESTQILKALNGLRLHRESREGRSYTCCCESGSTLGSIGLSSLVTRIRTRMKVSTVFTAAL